LQKSLLFKGKEDITIHMIVRMPRTCNQQQMASCKLQQNGAYVQMVHSAKYWQHTTIPGVSTVYTALFTRCSNIHSATPFDAKAAGLCLVANLLVII
jgi:hypothetical protein